MNRASTIADTLSVSDIKFLNGNETDLTSSSYERLKYQLSQVRLHNDDLRFVYLMGVRNNNVFFYVDSEQPKSKDYSAPGESYPEASAKLKRIFTNQLPFVEGPMRDSYGIWLSGLAPVVDPDTGRTLAVVGVDVAGFDYYLQTALVAIVPLALMAVPFLYVFRQRRLIAKEDEVIQLKEQFVSIASHELRSPLSGMLWAIQSLLNGKGVNAEQDHLLRSMYQSTQSSLATVNQILDATIFDRGIKPTLRHDVVELTSVVSSVVTTQILAAQEHGVTLKYAHGWPKHAYSFGDVSALKRAFMNLVSNAIKYSNQGGTVTFSYERANNRHIISIKDEGIGIPKADIPKILHGYYRSENATKKEMHGTGIGLFVTQAIVEEQGGRLTLDSEVGKGTTLHISMPIVDRHAKKLTKR
jgi:signal transduction histidine kinase